MSLNLKGIAKYFGDGEAQKLRILENLDLQIQPGEVLAIVGESGSGKSTLLSLVAGFAHPDAGTIEWNHEDLTPWTDDQWADFRKRRLGFVFQNYHLIPYLNALENVALPLRILHRENANEMARAMLMRLGLGARIHHLPNTLSGGERQRVAIARALIHQPGLILADEPTGSLDVNTGAHVLNLLFEVFKQRTQSAMLVTHSLEVASRCDRVLRLDQGRLWPT